MSVLVRRVMGFVNKIISRLDSEEKYEALMMDLGARHVSYGAKPQYIDVSTRGGTSTRGQTAVH